MVVVYAVLTFDFSVISMYFFCNQKKESQKQTEKEKDLESLGAGDSSPCLFGCVFTHRNMDFLVSSK